MFVMCSWGGHPVIWFFRQKAMVPVLGFLGEAPFPQSWPQEMFHGLRAGRCIILEACLSPTIFSFTGSH